MNTLRSLAGIIVGILLGLLFVLALVVSRGLSGNFIYSGF